MIKVQNLAAVGIRRRSPKFWGCCSHDP